MVPWLLGPLKMEMSLNMYKKKKRTNILEKAGGT